MGNKGGHIDLGKEFIYSRKTRVKAIGVPPMEGAHKILESVDHGLIETTNKIIKMAKEKGEDPLLMLGLTIDWLIRKMIKSKRKLETIEIGHDTRCPADGKPGFCDCDATKNQNIINEVIKDLSYQSSKKK
jgi:hypothetical protein